MKQLEVFSKCNCDPVDTNPIYSSWLTEQAALAKSPTAAAKLTMEELIPDKLFISRWVLITSLRLRL
jgi:hypothetical protein